MYASILHEFGPPENLRYEQVDTPVPGPGQVRIKVAAAGVHLVDTALRAGHTGGAFALPELPTIPGREVAGTVESLGPEADAGWLGKRVTAHLGMVPGGYAEFAVVGAERLHELPDDLPEDQALAMIGTGRTTMGILRFTELGPSDTVLVLAAAGGIGSLLVQYAKHRGATVIGAAGAPAKVAAVTDLGADLAVDYSQPDWLAAIREKLGADRPVSHVFEGVGGTLGRAALDLLAPGGEHLSYGYAATVGDASEPATLPEAELAARGISSRMVIGPPMMEKIGGPQNIRVLEDEALELAAAGTLVPLVHQFALEEADRAHHALETRTTIGKVVLIP
jgi:NADPH:quinone reductase-like Zn-dependent oxidoreductase